VQAIIPDKLSEIKARHEDDLTIEEFYNVDFAQMQTDRGDLLAYVETLTKERDEARRCAEGMADSHAILDGDDVEIEHRLAMREKHSPLPWEVKP